MTRRQNNRTTYLVQGNLGKYVVTMERLNNTVDGNPRWAATIAWLDSLINYEATWTCCYTFTGHYYNEQDEAGWIVRYHELKEQEDS